MATGNVIINVADVGQGQCTFVEIYDDSAKLVQTLLFDCGTDKSSTQTENNLKYIAGKVKAMETPAFDCIFFSHSDNDHISLTARLLKLCLPKKPAIKKVIYGGNFDQYEKDEVNILNVLVEQGYCTSDEIISPKTYHSNYDPDEAKYTGTLWENSDATLKVYSLVCNVLSSRGKWKPGEDVPARSSAVAKNTVSLVAGLYYAGSSYIICGDATKGTMGAVLKRMNGASVFGKNIMTTLPHHGSRTTAGLNAKSRTASVNARKVVAGFADLLASNTITVSAYALHSHPSLDLINIFEPGLTTPALRDARLKGENVHYMTANIDITLSYETKKAGRKRGMSHTAPTNEDTSYESSDNTFTTRYYESPPPAIFSYMLGSSSIETALGTTDDAGAINEFASWKYTNPPEGKLTLAGYSNLGADTAFTSAPKKSTVFETSGVGDERAEPVTRRALPPPPLSMPAFTKSPYREKLRQYN